MWTQKNTSSIEVSMLRVRLGQQAGSSMEPHLLTFKHMSKNQNMLVFLMEKSLRFPMILISAINRKAPSFLWRASFQNPSDSGSYRAPARHQHRLSLRPARDAAPSGPGFSAETLSLPAAPEALSFTAWKRWSQICSLWSLRRSCSKAPSPRGRCRSEEKELLPAQVRDGGCGSPRTGSSSVSSTETLLSVRARGAVKTARSARKKKRWRKKNGMRSSPAEKQGKVDCLLADARMVTQTDGRTEVTSDWRHRPEQLLNISWGFPEARLISNDPGISAGLGLWSAGWNRSSVQALF